MGGGRRRHRLRAAGCARTCRPRSAVGSPTRRATSSRRSARARRIASSRARSIVPAYAVSQIRDDGYLRLHRIGAGSRHPLWDQQFEAQQVRVLTTTGPVAGVVARSNGHFAAQHAGETAVVTADDLWIDVGAESRADVDGARHRAAGSRCAPPAAMADRRRAWRDRMQGDERGAPRSSLSAAAARRGVAQGRTTFVLSAQQVLGWVGLSSLVARGERIDQLTLFAPGENARRESEQPVDRVRPLRGRARQHPV